MKQSVGLGCSQVDHVFFVKTACRKVVTKDDDTVQLSAVIKVVASTPIKTCLANA